MRIYEVAVRKPVTILLLFVGLFVFSVYSLSRLPLDMFPEIEAPFISVVTYYSGADAEDVEENITRPLEDNLNAIPDLKQLTSTSRDNFSVVSLEFKWGSNLDEAMNNVRDVVGRVRRLLPDGVEQPTIFKFNTSMIPIVQYAATAEESYAALPEIMEDLVVNPLNRIEGVGSIGISGGAQRKIMVEFDPQRLESYHLTVEGVGAVLRQENANMPSGTIDVGTSTYPVRVEGEFASSDVLGGLVVGRFQDRSIYLRDVATIKDSLDKQTDIVQLNGRSAVSLVVMKQSGANTVQIVKDIRAMMPSLVQKLPPDVKLVEVYNSADNIEMSISSLAETVLYAALFVVLVVLFFLGRWRATFIIVLTIPISLVTSFIYLNFTGNTINVLSLSALSIAVGMVVDDAIVVLENITSHLERGSLPSEAAIYGTNEVALSVMASTLTVVAVFLPLTMLTGLSGIMFKQLGWSVTVVISISIVAALTLIPMLSSRLLRPSAEGRKRSLNVLQRGIRSLLDGLDHFYAMTLTWATRHRLVVVLLALLIFIGSLFLLPRIRTEFIPTADDARLSVSFQLPVGVREAYTGQVVSRVERQLHDSIPELLLVATSYGTPSASNVFAAFRGGQSNLVQMNLRLVDRAQRRRSTSDVSDVVRRILSGYPEVEKYSVMVGGGGVGGGGGMVGSPSIDVTIIGQDLELSDRYAELLKARMVQIPGVRDVDIARENYKHELDIRFDREKLAMHGMNTMTASLFVRNRINGLVATKYREGGKEYDVVVRYAERYRSSVEAVEDITLYTPQGVPFKLKEVAEVRYAFASPSIERVNRQRVIHVKCTMLNASMGAVVAGIERSLQQLHLPQGLDYHIGGTAQDQQEAFGDLGLLLLLVVFLVYIVMASQFESFRSPLIIMLSLPFALSGVLLALWLTDMTLNLISGIGAIMLVGIVVKNGIVLVDFINLLRERGYSTLRAVVEAGRSRLRPVLMTSLTTILGMVPMAVNNSHGSEMWRSMGMAVIGGLTFSTFITLIIVPTVYAVFTGAGLRRRRKKVHRARRRLLAGGVQG